MSLFVGSLAFEHAARDFSIPLRIGTLVGSIISALLGFAVLRYCLADKPRLGLSSSTEQQPAGLET